MAFRGYFALNGGELINSSRTVTHMGKVTPTADYVLGGSMGSCSPTLYPTDAGLAEMPSSSTELTTYPGLATPPDGSYLYSPGLSVMGECWSAAPVCGCGQTPWFSFDDSWPGLQSYLQDTVYRPEMAPWYSSQIPQSAEFAGYWVSQVSGFDTTSVQRPITEMVGSGAIAGPARDNSRQLQFTVLVIACTNAGLEYGISWLDCQLRTTNDAPGTLTYFTAHPNTAAQPSSLARQMINVVLTQSVTVQQRFNPSGIVNQQATMALVQFTLTALNPYAWLPSVTVPVTWDTIATQSLAWVPAAQSALPDYCTTPLSLSTTCAPDPLTVTTDRNPPVCGGGLPICAIERYTFSLPETLTPVLCPGTAVTTVITTTGPEPVTLEGYWVRTGTLEVCSNQDLFPFQIAGLPGYTALTLDGISGRYWAVNQGVTTRPLGIVGTPSGAPWLPPFVDRTQAWQLEVLAPEGAEFSVELILYDQEP